MDPYWQDWLDLLLRWLHVVAGIVWIGTSFYFVALDKHLLAPRRMEDAERTPSVCNDRYARRFMNEQGLRIFEPFRSETLPNVSNLVRCRIIDEFVQRELDAHAPARVVTVASVGHRQGTLDLDDLGFARGGYRIMRAYARSKLANVLFAAELARRLAGSGVTSNSLHPGAPPS